MTTVTADMRKGPRLRTAAAVAVAIALIQNTLGVFTEVEIHWTNWLLGFLIVGVAAAVVFGRFVRRASGSATKSWRTGLVLAVFGLLTVAAFWSWLPPIFGVAAMYLGFAAYQRGTSATARRAGIGVVILGVLAIVLDVAVFADDIASRV